MSTSTHPFGIQEETRRAIVKNSHLIKNVSRERIRDEFVKILMSKNPNTLQGLAVTGLLKYIIPEIVPPDSIESDPGAQRGALGHIVAVLEKSPERLDVRLAALLHCAWCFGAPRPPCPQVNAQRAGAVAQNILLRMRFDSKRARRVSVLVAERMNLSKHLSPLNVKRLVVRVGADNLRDLFDFETAHARAGACGERSLRGLRALEKEVFRVLNSGEPLTVGDLAVNGRDLMEWGMEKGEELGKALDFMLGRVLENPELNTVAGLRAAFRDFVTGASASDKKGKR